MLLDPDRVFSLASGLALMGWLALAVSPAQVRWAPLARRVAGRWLPALLALIYLAMLIAHWRGEGGFGSLAEVQVLFNVPGALVAGWVHYLAFDLFVGGWISARAAESRISHLVLLPVLLLTFLAGPVGWLAFSLIRPKESLT
jgi:hypothetical protein